MFRKILLAGAVFALCAGAFMGCDKKTSGGNPVTPPVDTNRVDSSLLAPAGFTKVFAEGFESLADTSLWDETFVSWGGMDYFPRMRFTTDAAYSGTHALTSDSNANALQYQIEPRFDTAEGNTVVGVQFYLMAKSASGINFTVGLGKNAGSSAGLNKQFGIGFDSSNVLKTVYTDDQSMFGNYDSLLSSIPFQANHWYKCRVEINLNPNVTGATAGISYYVDGVKVRTVATPNQAFPAIDRLLVFRGRDGAEGAKQVYVDDIVVYKK